MGDAIKVEKTKSVLPTGEIREVSIHLVPTPVPPSAHDFKYRLVLIRNSVRVIGFDNERGKGDHRHLRGVETPYEFVSLAQLLIDFDAEIEKEVTS